MMVYGEWRLGRRRGGGVDTKRKLSVEGKIHSVYNNTKDG